MSGKKGRKCSMKFCDNYQHTHKHLSFFRFPKDPERCKLWIEKSERPDLSEKVNVHEERVCERHFDPSMFLNDFRNRLHQAAVPVIRLTNEPPMPELPFRTDLSLSLINENKLLNLRKAEILYKAQLAANNLTITPSNGNNTSSSSNKYSPDQPLNLSTVSITPSPSLTPSSSATSFNTPKTSTIASNPGYKRPRQIFTLQQEEQLAVYVRDTANYYSGLSSKEVRILAFVYGVCNLVEMPVGWRESHQASFDWCVGFIKRNKLAPMIITALSVSSKNNNNINAAAKYQQQQQQQQQVQQLPKTHIANTATVAVASNGNSSIGTSTPIEID